MEAGGMSPRRVAKHQRVDWSAANKGFGPKKQLLGKINRLRAGRSLRA